MNDNVIEFLKYSHTKSPVRANATDAGIDVYLPSNSEPIVLGFGDSLFIDSEIYCKIPNNYALIAFNKSGNSLKKGVLVGGGVIDEKYTGKIFIQLNKVVNKRISFIQKLKNFWKYRIFGDVTIFNPNDKLVQFILIPMNYADVKITNISDCSVENFFNGYQSTRGADRHGSTDKK